MSDLNSKPSGSDPDIDVTNNMPAQAEGNPEAGVKATGSHANTNTETSLTDNTVKDELHNKKTVIGEIPGTSNSRQVLPTDVSLVCDEKVSRHKETASQPSSKRSYQLMLVIGLILAFLLAMGYQTLFGHSDQPKGEMVVDEGQSYYGFLPKFQKDVPMFSSSLAKLYIKSRVHSPLNAGIYEIPENPSLLELLEAFNQAKKTERVSVQIIEGKTAADLFKVLANTKGITLEVLEEDGTPKPDFKQLMGIDAVTPEGEFSNNLEGWFSPDTYYYEQGVTDKQILTDLYQRQKSALDKAWQNRAEGLPYKTPYEALIMASIVEKETAVASERNLVSAVFFNRLKKGMRLQTDPTIIYGIRDRYDGNIRRTDIDEKTAYNTYQIDGLPPTPIALPSQAAIEATLHPADSDALYFVATGNGGHKFSKTLAEHNRAVQDYLTVMRQNKSNSSGEAQ